MIALKDKNQQIVGGEGPLDCKIALIGEALGWEEAKEGRPFVGNTGKELDQLLHNAGIYRMSCYITNVIKERPPGNDIATFIDLDSSRITASAEYLEYKRMLDGELKKCTANVLVAIGNVSLYALTGLYGITKWHGSILKSLNGRKVVPIIHPAATFHEYLFTYSISRDLKTKVLPQSEFPDIRLPLRNIRTWPTFSEAMAYLETCLQEDLVTIDIESINRKTVCFGIARSEHDAMCIPFISPKGPWYSPDEELEIWTLVAKIMEELSIKKRGQNLTYDCWMLLRQHHIKSRNLEDTMIGMAMVYPDLPKDLASITAWYTDEPYYKDERKNWKNPGGDMGNFWIYNGLDCCVTHEVMPKIGEDLAELGNEDAFEKQNSMVEPILYMQERGIKVDKSALAIESQEQGKLIDGLQEGLNKICGRTINAGSPKQLKEYFYIEKGIKPFIKKGAITTNDNAMKRLATGTSTRRPLPEAKLVLEIRRAGKLKSNYLDVKLDPDDRLRCTIKPVGEKFGRFSTSANIFGTGTNMQNLPQSFRKHLLADPGYLLYSVDLSQAENRNVAYIAPEPSMIKAFKDGVDVHNKTAGLIFNISPEQVSDEPGSSSIGDGLHSQRFWGKTLNHAFNYDLGHKAFALDYQLKEREAKQLRDAYFSIYPGVKKYHLWIQDDLRKSRKITNCFGRTYLFLDRWGDDLFRSAYAYIPQSTVAYIIDIWGIDPIYKEQDLFGEVELLLQIHDEILFQIHLKHGIQRHAEILTNIKKSLERPVKWKNITFTIPAECAVGLNWSKKHMIKINVNNAGQTISSLLEAYRKLEIK